MRNHIAVRHMHNYKCRVGRTMGKSSGMPVRDLGRYVDKRMLEEEMGDLRGETGGALLFFFSSRRRHTRLQGDWSSDVCSSDLGGTVEKYIGDEIYALFGAPVAHEDDPARAIRAADAARRWVGGQRADDVTFEVRIGVETGEAVIDLAATDGSHQQMSVGAVVNVASRLCHHAEPGQALVGPVARRATEEFATFRALGPVDLKGAGPTEAVALGD